MTKLLRLDFNLKSIFKNGVLASFLLISSFASAQLQRDALQRVDSNNERISEEAFTKGLLSTQPEELKFSDQDLAAALSSTRDTDAHVVNGDFEYGNYHWYRRYARTVYSSSPCGGDKVMKLYGRYRNARIAGLVNNLTPGDTYTINWEEYGWDGYRNKYKIYIAGTWSYINEVSNDTGWTTRSITFTASNSYHYIWFKNRSYWNLYLDCINVDGDDTNCDDLAFDLPDEQICSGDSVTLNGPDGFDFYLWSTGETTQNITVSPTETTVYSITATLGDCDVSNALEVSINEPFAGIEGDSEICLGESSTLTVVGEAGLSYVWFNGETTASISVSPEADTTYSVTVDNGTCTSVKEFTVNVIDISFDLADETINEGESVTLSAPAGMDSYLWSTGETTQDITVSPDSTTVYSITVNNFGCEYINFIEVTVVPMFGGNSSILDIKVSIDGMLSINTNASKSMQLDYQVYSLNGLLSTNGAFNTHLIEGNNALRIDLNQHYNLRANSYYVLIVNSANWSAPKRIKFISK